MKHLRNPLLFALAVTLFAAPSLATQTRIKSLGGGEKSFTIRDQANIWVLPQFLPDHFNQVDVDNAAGAAYGTMSVRYALTDDAVLLLYGARAGGMAVVNSPTPGGNTAASAAGFSPAFGAAPGNGDPANHQFGIGFGTRLGETMRLGVHLGIGGARQDADANNQNNATVIDFAAGFGLDLGGLENTLDFGLRLNYATFTNKEGGAPRYVTDGLLNFGLLVKGEFRVHQIAKLVPYFNFSIDNRAVFHDRRTEPQFQAFEAKRGSSAMTNVRLGTDLAIEPDSGEWLVQPGVGLSFLGATVNGTDKVGGQVGAVEDGNIITPYYGFSAEARTFDWLTLRLGARQSIVLTNNNNTAPPPGNNESHSSTVVNNVTFGVGIHAPTAAGKSARQQRGWKIDLNINPAFMNNGPNLLTGNTTQNFAVDFAMVYAWN